MPIQMRSESDFPSLTIDAAIQLDLLQRRQEADLAAIAAFGRYLASPSGYTPGAGYFALSENPVNVQILSSALSGTGAHATNMDELKRLIDSLVKDVESIVSGSKSDDIILFLKSFCLALHRVLLDELTPATDEEWMPVYDSRFT